MIGLGEGVSAQLFGRQGILIPTMSAWQAAGSAGRLRAGLHPCALALALASIAAACSSGDPVGEPADGGEPADEPTTLAEFLGAPWLSFNPEDQETMFVRQQQQVQEMVADCMAREGFEYVPTAAPQSDFFYSDPFDAEFAREHGFGITTSLDTMGEASSDAFVADNVSDPNTEIVDALSESERAAYFEALYGGEPSAGALLDPDTGEVEEFSDLGDRGCMGRAQSEVWENDKMEAFFEQFDMESMYERVGDGPADAGPL